MPLSQHQSSAAQENLQTLEQQLEYGPMALVLEGSSSERSEFLQTLTQVSLSAYEVLPIGAVTSPSEALNILAHTMGLMPDSNLQHQIVELVSTLDQNLLLLIETDGVSADMLSWWMSWLSPSHPVFPCVKMLFIGEYAAAQLEQIHMPGVDISSVDISSPQSVPDVPFEQFSDSLMGQIANETASPGFGFHAHETNPEEELDEDESGKWLWPSVFIGAGVGIGAAVAFIMGTPSAKPKLLEDKQEIVVDFSIGEGLDGTYSPRSMSTPAPEPMYREEAENNNDDEESEETFYHPLSKRTTEQDSKFAQLEDEPEVPAKIEPEPKPDLHAKSATTTEVVDDDHEDPLFQLAREFDEVLEQSSEDKYVLSRYQHNYTLQILAARSRDNIEQFINRNKLSKGAHIIDFSQHKPWYVLIYGDYKDQKAAIRDLKQLPVEVQNQKPLARTYKGIQDQIMTR